MVLAGLQSLYFGSRKFVRKIIAKKHTALLPLCTHHRLDLTFQENIKDILINKGLKK
jgi:hypothetical protein